MNNGGAILVITGPPGAGKSTVASIVVDRFAPSVLVEGDEFFRFLARGAVQPWLREAHEQNEAVIGAAAAATGRFAEAGFITVFDGVVGPWFLPRFLEHLRVAPAVPVHYVVLCPPVERCLGGVMTRTDHGFRDEPATRQMHAEFASADIEARYVMTELPDVPRLVADMVVDAMVAGTLLVRSA